MLAYKLIEIADRLSACARRSLEPIIEGHQSAAIRSEAQGLIDRITWLTEQATDTSDLCLGIYRLSNGIDDFRLDVQRFITKL